MTKSFILDVITQTFNPEQDIPLGPWCFQGVENIYPDWDRLDFIHPFENAAEMDEASYQVISLYEGRVLDFTKGMNTYHRTSLSLFSWRHLLLGWYVMLTQVSYTRFRHIEKFIEQHQGQTFHVKIAPKDVVWDLAVSHNLSQLTSRADFDYWLSSLIIREIAPKDWILEEDPDFEQQVIHKAQASPALPSLSLREKIRDKVLLWIDRGRFDRVYGTSWRSQLFFCLFLKGLPACKRKEKAHIPVIEGLKPQDYFSKTYLKLLDHLAERTMPRCYADQADFKRRLDQAAQDSTYQAGKIRVIAPDIFKEELKFKTVLAYEAGEKIVATQHGSWYGTVSSATISHMVEYAHDTFLSWGWDQHLYKGHYIPLPSPLLNRHQKERKKAIKSMQTSSLLFVENIVNLRSSRLSGQPMPADIVARASP